MTKQIKMLGNFLKTGRNRYGAFDDSTTEERKMF